MRTSERSFAQYLPAAIVCDSTESLDETFCETFYVSATDLHCLRREYGLF